MGEYKTNKVYFPRNQGLRMKRRTSGHFLQLAILRADGTGHKADFDWKDSENLPEKLDINELYQALYVPPVFGTVWYKIIPVGEVFIILIMTWWVLSGL